MPASTRIDVARCTELYEAGHTLTEVAAITGVSASQLSKILRRFGCRMRGRPRKGVRARNDLICRLREETDLTWAQIGAQVGTSGATACQAFLNRRPL